jgi:hypothetical protein
MAEAGMSELLSEVFKIAFEIVAYLVGRVVVELLSLGCVKCLPAGMKVEKSERRAWGLYVRRRNRIYLPDEVVAFVGMLSIVLTLVGGCGAYWLVHR